MKNDFTYCPKCGSKEIKNVNMRKWLCPDCGFDLYNNVAGAVGLLIETGENKILFEKRAKNPRKGYLAFPGGFVDPDESAEEACFRECREEIGVEPVSLKYIASYPNTYEYKDIQYKTCDMFFEAKLPEKAKLRPQEGEVLSFEECFVRNEKDLADLPLAFESARKVLKKWLENKE